VCLPLSGEISVDMVKRAYNGQRMNRVETRNCQERKREPDCQISDVHGLYVAYTLYYNGLLY
jgi:hypothetical protein